MVNIKGNYGLGVTQALGREGLTLKIAQSSRESFSRKNSCGKGCKLMTPDQT